MNKKRQWRGPRSGRDSGSQGQPSGQRPRYGSGPRRGPGGEPDGNRADSGRELDWRGVPARPRRTFDWIAAKFRRQAPKPAVDPDAPIQQQYIEPPKPPPPQPRPSPQGPPQPKPGRNQGGQGRRHERGRPHDRRHHGRSRRQQARREPQAAPSELSSATEVARVTEGRLLGTARRTITGVSIDTRTIKPGDLYFALRGKRLDGHQFVPEALHLGASGVVVDSEAAAPVESMAIVVKDTTRALGRLAAAYRSRFDLQVFAVTGSNGKSTTKELIAAMLAHRVRTVYAEASFNNDIGVPLTVLRLNRQTQAAVFELEMNEPGGTARLAQMCQPKYGVITNIGDTHLEAMKSRAGVAKEKAELLQNLSRSGVAVLNADDPAVMELAGVYWTGRVVTFGLEQTADVWASDIKDQGLAGVQFRLQGMFQVSLPMPGMHNVSNCLAACAAMVAAGVPLERALPGLARFKPLPMRLSVRPLAGVTLIDDCYNANPQSVRAGLEVLSSGTTIEQRIAFLGDMLELGDESPRLHYELGRYVAGIVSRLALVGPSGEHVARGAVEAGMVLDRVHRFETSEQAAQAAFDLIQAGDRILVKGSRATAMELVSQEIIRRYAQDSNQPG